MRVSLEWLKEYVQFDLSVAELAERLTMSGIAVEAIIDQAAQFNNMVVGKVTSLEKHPGADHLTITHIDIGPGGVKQIVTAAKNLNVGDVIPLALAGTVLPGGKVINDVEMRGVLSQGMLCSGEELELEKESAGIWVFNQEWPVGTPVAEALGATDYVLELELTANRSDCLGMIGVAREVAAVLNIEFKVNSPQVKEQGPAIAELASVKIADLDLCPRYAVRVAQQIKIAASPAWMQRRLKAAGVRPINNIVDITNYVMLEYNQPLHAFDLDRIAGGDVIVRRAVQAEKMVTLDQVERRLSQDDLLIADPQQGQCVAGVMGGCNSEVTEQTLNLLLESAFFNPINIRKTAKTLEMRTEASLRFERGIDPNGTLDALNRAAELIEELGVGIIARGFLDQYPEPVKPLELTTSYAKINRLLGTSLEGEAIKGYLQRVNFEVTSNSTEQFTVKVPTCRRDIFTMADLAEEVARLYGYDRIPVTLPASHEAGQRTPFQKFQVELRRLLEGAGLSEIVTYSLNAKDTASKLGIAADSHLSCTVDLLAPLSEEQAVMRTTLAPGMLEVLAFNAKRRQTDLSLFEIARVYWPKDGALLPEEPLHLSIGLMGRRDDLGWNQTAAEVDFYDLKGLMELIVDRFKLPALELRRSTQPFLHPGQSADLLLDGQVVGMMGRLHPTTQQQFDLTKNVFLIEVDLARLDAMRNPQVTFAAPPRFPAVQRDLALVLPQEITSHEVIEQIKTLSGGLVESVELFDVYQGEQVAANQRSLAFSLSYRSKERTLNDAEVNRFQTELLEKLNAQYGAMIRA